jgi:predicted Fe-Mo cluster-binding NifX family protein
VNGEENEMKVVVSSNGSDLEAPASATFGRCPMYLFVDTESMQFEAAPNPASDAPGGAGVRAAQFVTGADVKAVITGNVGPNAINVLHAAGVPVYLFRDGTVRQAVEDFMAGNLSTVSEQSVPGGKWKSRGQTTESTSPSRSREEEIEALKTEAMDLRKKMTSILERIDRLQEGS